MKKIFTLFTFVFLNTALLFGQCPDLATPNPTNKIFNMTYTLEADRDAAWEALGTGSITFPAGVGCMCGDMVTIDTSGLEIDGPIGADNTYRIRARTSIDDYFGGENGNFIGSLTFTNMDGTSETCEYEAIATSNSNIIGNTPLVLFPNPVKDQLTISNGKGKATIFNVLGQPVQHLIINDNQATIHLADLIQGQYYINVLQENGVSIVKQFSKVN